MGILPGLSTFYVQGLDNIKKIGLGAFSSFGLGMNYNSYGSAATTRWITR